jgi:hypothetical protein
MKTAALLIAAAAIGAAAPALAAAKAEDGTPLKVVYDAKHDKYCVRTPDVTGSFLPQKDCRTKEDWAKAGLQIHDQNEAKLAAK